MEKKTTIVEILERIKSGTATPKELGIVCSLRNLTIHQEGFETPLEYCFTLREWKDISNESENVSDEDFLSIVPHLKDFL